MSQEHRRQRIAARLAGPAALGLALLALHGCATGRQACYESVEIPDNGLVLRAAPCPADDARIGRGA